MGKRKIPHELSKKAIREDVKSNHLRISPAAVNILSLDSKEEKGKAKKDSQLGFDFGLKILHIATDIAYNAKRKTITQADVELAEKAIHIGTVHARDRQANTKKS